MSGIYTKTGDSGMTSLKGGLRVLKTDIRIETNGAIDELNTAIGLVRAFMDMDDRRQPFLKDIQMRLMTLMSSIASMHLEGFLCPNFNVEKIEKMIDEIESSSVPSEYFIIPGGSKVSALMHFARTSARKAERQLLRLNDSFPLSHHVLMYLNRLSDLFFVMARHEQLAIGIPEERWKRFGSASRDK
ncbi:MAG: cob(I)yrinic acid a,c-diamide adenosyltransferase [Paramuribaculum sp.]|nr:cob(I)yrinic acid a,c-diamide adenosyltransferase [Paramuribaculum sp.]